MSNGHVVGIYRFDVKRDGKEVSFEGSIKEFGDFYKKTFNRVFTYRDKYVTRTFLREEKKTTATYLTYTLVSTGKTVRAGTMHEGRHLLRIWDWEKFKKMVQDDEILIHRVDKKTGKKRRDYPRWYEHKGTVKRSEKSDRARKRALNRYYLERANVIELSHMENPE